jgi:hypothetical protein
MKKIFALCIVTAAIIAGLVWRAAVGPSHFGEFTDASQVQVADLAGQPYAYLGKTVEVEGTIAEQCKTMGCYFFFRSPKGSLRVDLQEIAMTAPMREGHSARVQGQLVPYDGGYQLSANAVEFK